MEYKGRFSLKETFIVFSVLASLLSCGLSQAAELTILEVAKPHAEGASEYFKTVDANKASSPLTPGRLVEIFNTTMTTDYEVILSNENVARPLVAFETLKALFRNISRDYSAPWEFTPKKADEALKVLRQEGAIDDLIYYLLRFEFDRSVLVDTGSVPVLGRSSLEIAPISLPDLLTKKKEIMEALGDTKITEPEINPLGKKPFRQSISEVEASMALRVAEIDPGNYKPVKLGGLTPRTRLYFNFDSDQILQLAHTLRVAIGRINASGGAKIVFSYGKNEDCSWCDEDGVDAIELDPTDQYKAALRLFQSMFGKLKLTSSFQTVDPNNMDVVAAAFEMGYISKEHIEALGDISDLELKKKGFWKKALEAGKSIVSFSKIGARFISGYALVPVLILDAVFSQQKNKQEPDHADRIIK